MYDHLYIYVNGHKWFMTQRVLKSHKNKMGIIYMQYVYNICTIYLHVYICIYICIYSDVMKTIQCTHPPHHHNGFVATCRLWTATGRPYPACRHKAIVVMKRMDALDCLHGVTIYVLCSLLCACWTLCVSWTNFCFN